MKFLMMCIQVKTGITGGRFYCNICVWLEKVFTLLKKLAQVDAIKAYLQSIFPGDFWKAAFYEKTINSGKNKEGMIDSLLFARNT